MSKPSELPVWATDANYVAPSKPWDATPTIVEPSAGKKAQGFYPDERPTAQYLQWWMNLVYLWIVYVDAGIWDGDLFVDGNLTIAAGKKLIPDGGAGQQISVDGGIAAGNAITNPSSVLALGGNLIARANDPTTEDNGKVYFDGYERLALATGLARDPGAAHGTIGQSNIILAASASPLYIPIYGIPIGAQVVGMKVWFKKGTSNASEIIFTVVRSQNGGADDYMTDAVAVNDSTNATGDKSVESTSGGGFFMESGYQYYLRIDPSASVAPGADHFYSAELIWNHPDP